MRKINEIIVHCSATREGSDYHADDIRRWHLERGYRDIGYHYVVTLHGTIENGRPEEQIGAHTKGHNAHSIGVCYIGGLDKDGKAKDTRTAEQKKTLGQLLRMLHLKYPDAKILGHRDTSPDTNHNGKVDRWEWLKDCPCFDVASELEGWKIPYKMPSKT